MDVKLTNAVNVALDVYYGTVRISDVLQFYDGNKSALARQLAGISPDGALPRIGTKERTSYNSQLKAVGRYLDYEQQGVKTSGNRNPENKAAQKKLKEALAAKEPPTNMDISIGGEIKVSEDVRDREVNINSDEHPIDVSAFLDNVKGNNERGAFAECFHNYCRNMSVNVLDSVSIQFS